MKNEHEKYMREAITLAEMAAAGGEIPVGAVIVKNGNIIGRGCNARENTKDPLGHAEIAAIRDAALAEGDWRLQGCTMYVTLEPCPMCAGAIISARLDAVVYGAFDPEYGCFGSRIAMNHMQLGASPAVTAGILEDECEKILSDFFQKRRKNDGYTES